MAYQVHAGGQVTVSFYDSAAERYVERNFTVMALVNCNDIYGTGNLEAINIWLTAAVMARHPSYVKHLL